MEILQALGLVGMAVFAAALIGCVNRDLKVVLDPNSKERFAALFMVIFQAAFAAAVIWFIFTWISN